MSDSAIPWIVPRQAPLSMEFSRQEYGHGLPLPTLGDLANSGNEPMSPDSPVFADGFLPLSYLGSLYHA